MTPAEQINAAKKELENSLHTAVGKFFSDTGIVPDEVTAVIRKDKLGNGIEIIQSLKVNVDFRL